MEVEGKAEGSKEEYEVSIEGEEILVFEYNRKNGNFSIESEEFEFEGKLLSERNAVTVSFDVEDVEVNVSISKGTNFEKIKGTEFNIGEASEDDYMDLYEENEELIEYIGDLDYYF